MKSIASVKHAFTAKTSAPLAIRLLTVGLSFSSAVFAPNFAQAKAPGLLERVSAKIEAGKEKRRADAKQILADLDPKISANLDFSIFNGFKAGLKYTYSVDPAYQANLHMRVDRWRPRLTLKPPGLFTRIEAGSEVVFIRNFPSRGEALKAMPEFNLAKLPLKSDNALRLQPGEAVMMPVDLNLLFGDDVSTSTSPVSAYARGYYVLRGRYQVQVLRLGEEKVRLRLMAIRTKGLEAEVGVKLNLEIFEFSPLNSVVEGILGRKLGFFNFGKATQSVVMADYLFDLANPEARNAYDRLLAADQRFSHMKMANPLAERDQLQSMMISDLATVDQIAGEDKLKAPELRRISRFFKGNSSGEVEKEAFKNFNVNLINFVSLKRESTLTQDNRIVFLNEENEESSFLAPQAVKESRFKLLFGLRNEFFARRAMVVVPTDERGEVAKVGEYVVSVEVKDKRMGKSESRDILKYFRRSVAPVAVTELALEKLLDEARYRNARVFVQIIFNEDALLLLRDQSARKLDARLKTYLRDVLPYLPREDEEDNLDWIEDRRDDMTEMVIKMATVLNSTLPVQERIRMLMNLQKESIFREIGTGFIMSMLPQAQLKNLLSVSVRADAKSFTGPVIKEFGTSDFKSVVRASEYIQNLLTDGTFDVRLESFGAQPAAPGQVFPLKAIKTAVPSPMVSN